MMTCYETTSPLATLVQLMNIPTARLARILHAMPWW